MSSRGECWHNAAMESFFSTQKTERCARTIYQISQRSELMYSNLQSGATTHSENIQAGTGIALFNAR